MVRFLYLARKKEPAAIPRSSRGSARAPAPAQDVDLPAETEIPDYGDLAGRLIRFYQEFDPYDYRDNMELGETDEDAIATLESQLQEEGARTGILETLQKLFE